MDAKDSLHMVARDTFHAFRLVSKSQWRRTLYAWLAVPLGITAVLAVCFGINSLISLSSVSFPGSVATMIILFLLLILCEQVLGDRKTRQMVGFIEIPCGFALRYINIFLCPGFVLLPLSPPISGAEVGKIIAVCLIGFAVVFILTAYFVRGLLLMLGTSKRAQIERAEEMGNEDDNIPLSVSTRQSEENRDPPPTESGPQAPLMDDIQQPLRAQDPDRITGTGGPPIQADSMSQTIGQTSVFRHDPAPLTRPEIWAAYVNARVDLFTYAGLMVLVGVPVYYGVGYAMPIQLCLNILTYQLASGLPLRWKQYLHPILLSSGFTILGCWVLALIHGDSLATGLEAYSTGANYSYLWRETYGIPGAGDVLSSLIDVSIIALALPMFQYRTELKRNFVVILAPNLTISVASLFGYPAVCNALGIASSNSLAFASRNLTLALAQIAVANLGGNANVGTPLAIFSGILGVLLGQWALKKLRIPEDDYITRGITLGVNSSSLATAMLLTSDPRAAAFSSLSMGLFGTISVACTSVPPIVGAIRAMVGLS